jgi:hypothetical protein
LPPEDRRTIIALVAALPLVDLSIRLAGLKRTQAWLCWLTRNVATRTIDGAQMPSAHRLAELANIVGTHGPYTARCLPQALLVQYRLRRRGLSTELRIGATNRTTQTIEAHAWVELDGVPLGQRDLGFIAFPGLDRLPL